jgi:hypothetical protein
MEPNQLPTYRDLSAALPRPSPMPERVGSSGRAIVSLTRLLKMVAVWGLLYYARWMVLAVPPADLSPARELIGTWETDDDGGLQLEFTPEGSMTLRRKQGEPVFQGNYVLPPDPWTRKAGSRDNWQVVEYPIEFTNLRRSFQVSTRMSQSAEPVRIHATFTKDTLVFTIGFPDVLTLGGITREGSEWKLVNVGAESTFRRKS